LKLILLKKMRRRDSCIDFLNDYIDYLYVNKNTALYKKIFKLVFYTDMIY